MWNDHCAMVMTLNCSMEILYIWILHMLNFPIRSQVNGWPTSKSTCTWIFTKVHICKCVHLHLGLLNGNTVYLYKYLWKMKVPLKTKIFMWFLQRKEILTKDNLAKRNWLDCKKCCFCDHDESIQHLFVRCPFVRIIWQLVYMAFNITHPWALSICLVIGLMELKNLRKLKSELVFMLCSQLYMACAQWFYL
jgi:hypothetical protein